MSPGRRGKSLFTVGEQSAWTLIHDTVNNPDTTCQHRSENDKKVCKKIFDIPVGIHGRTQAVCYSITVIYDMRSNNVVTAYPTV